VLSRVLSAGVLLVAESEEHFPRVPAPWAGTTPGPWPGTYWFAQRVRAAEPSHLSADSSSRSTETIVSGLR
jgi:hypothetical protein